MVAPDLLTSVGFQRRKFGAGDKESGYAIDGGRLRALLIAAAFPLFALGSLLTWSRLEIRIERRAHRREARAGEHGAAAGLAQAAAGRAAGRRSSIERDARGFGLDPAKALSLADAAMEEIMSEMRERAHFAEDGLEEGGEMSPEEIKLSALVGGFLETYKSYTQEFAGAAAAPRGGDAVCRQLRDPRGGASGEDPVREGGAHARLQAIGRQGLEPHLRKGTSVFMRSILDYLDVLLATPHVPHGALAAFEREWQRAERDPYSLLMQVHSWQDEGKIPGLWLEHAMKLYDDALARH